MTAEHPLERRFQTAVENLSDLIRREYPTARFEIARAPDEPENLLLFATVDVDDPDEVLGLMMDKLLHYQLSEDVPVHVIPLQGSTTIEDALVRAIQQLRVVELVDAEGRRRTVEPHAIFLTARRKRYLHCFQVQGYSRSGGLPQWRNLPLEHIREISLTDHQFTPRQDFNPADKTIFDHIEAQVTAPAA